MTRTEQRAYLRAEHERLMVEHLRMRRDFEALRMRDFSKYEVRAQIQRLRAHFNLLENHLLGLDWMRRPPWDRI